MDQAGRGVRLWGLAATLVAVGVVVYVFTRPGVFECFWRYEEADFCYAAAALRFSEGAGSSGLIDHPGYPQIQGLAWFYRGLWNLGFLSSASFSEFASHPDPLLQLREYISASRWFSALVYVSVIFTVFFFSRLITRSSRVAFFAAVLASLSPYVWRTILSTRPEALSALLGLASMWLMFKAMHVTRYRTCLLLVLGSSTALALSVLTKLNAYPLIAILPWTILLADQTPFDRKPTRVIARTFVVLAGLHGVLALLVAWVGPSRAFESIYGSSGIEILKHRLSIALAAVFVLGPIAAACVSVFRQAGRRNVSRCIARGAAVGATLVLLFSGGWVVAALVSLAHPSWDPTTITGPVQRDLLRALFLVAAPAFSRVTVTVSGVSPAGLAELWHTVSAHFLSWPRLLDYLFVLVVTVAYWRRQARLARVAAAFFVVGLLMAAFSGLRYLIWTYVIYEDLPRTMAVAVCVGIVGASLWESRSPVQRVTAWNMRSLALAGFVLFAVGSRASSLAQVGAGPGCPTLNATSKACICGYYGAKVGLPDLVASRYGGACSDGAVRWEREYRATVWPGTGR